MKKSSTIRRLFGFALPFWRGIALSILLGVFTIGSSIGLMMTSAWLISKAGLQPSIAVLGVAPVMVRFFGISRGVFRYLERLVSHNITFQLLADLRVWFYERLEPLAPARLMQYRSGDLLERVIGDIETLENIYVRVIAPPLVALVTGTITAALFGVFDPLAALVLAAFMLLTATLPPLLAWWTGQKPGRETIHARAELNAALVDGIQGLADSIAYGHTAAQLKALDHLNDTLMTQENRIAWLDSVQMFLAVLLVNIAALTVLVIAIPRVDPVFLATLTLGTIAVFEAITPLAAAAQNLGANVTAAERLFEIVDADPAVTEPSDPQPIPDDTTLTINHLRFSYTQGDIPALDGLSLTIQPGERVAIVGPSGAGKSTLANLLLHFYDPTEGSIQLGGEDIRHYGLDDLHQTVGVMSQRTHLFNTTIYENIHIADKSAPEEAVTQAAEQAHIHDFITSLPDGYRTFVGEGGAKVSGGECQRIALARLLLKQSPIVILDEATANLDAITERAVMESVLQATTGKTLLVITHRLTLLDAMGRIYVLHEGQLVESGTHQQLIAQEGLYQRMWQMQNRTFERDYVIKPTS